ncbi:MAG: hypothetical protein HYY48_08425 [Gammaproteobacteria bacterium]|nr:hypothetical protein [Gammaproteobacteria bacterium]
MNGNNRVETDASRIRQIVERNPEYLELYDNAHNLRQGIIDKDRENQKNQKK